MNEDIKFNSSLMPVKKEDPEYTGFRFLKIIPELEEYKWKRNMIENIKKKPYHLWFI